MALTPTDMQASAMIPQGGITRPATSPEVQVAGPGKIGWEFLKRLLKLDSSPRRGPGEVPRVEPRLDPESDPKPDPRGAAPRVPTPAEESVMGEGYSYRTTQKAAAKKVLTPSGQKRFDERGQRAFEVDTEQDNILKEARAALQAESAEIPPVDGAKGVVSDDAADRVLSAYENAQEAMVDTSEGLDFNFDKLKTGDDVKALINSVSEVFKDPVEVNKRGVRSHAETLASAEQLLADEIGFTKTLLSRKIGDTLNAEQMTAARMLLEKGLVRLQGFAHKIQMGQATTEEMLKFRRQMAIQAAILMNVKGAQTEAARTVNAFNIPIGSDAVRTPEQAEQIMQLLNEAGGEREVRFLAKGFLESLTKGRANANKFVERGWWSRANGMVQEGFVNGMLGWTTTHLKNLIATPAFMMYRVPVEVIAGVFGHAERGLSRVMGWKGVDQGAYMGEAAARIWGWKESFQDAWVVAYEAMRRGTASDHVARLEAQQYRQIRGGMGFKRIPVVGETLSDAMDILGKAVRIPQALLLGADEFWKTQLQRGDLYAKSYRAAASASSRGDSLEDAVDEGMMVLLDPKAVSAEITEHAREVLLQTSLGDLGKITGSIQSWTLGRMQLPFVKAPSWAVLRSAENHPALMVFNPNFWRDLASKTDPARRQKRLAQMTMGSGVAYLVAEQAMSGRITGGYPRDPKTRMMLPDNWRPYSFVFRKNKDEWPRDKDGDLLPLIDVKTGLYNGDVVYVSYAGIEPVGAIIAMTAATVEIMRREDDPVKAQDMAGALIASVSDYILSMPFLQQMSAIQASFRYGDLQRLTDGPLGNFYGVPVGGGVIPGVEDGVLVPIPKFYSAIERQVSKVMDPARGEINEPLEYFTYDEVMAMPKVNGEAQWELIGSVKKGNGEFFRDIFISGYNKSMRESPYFSDSAKFAQHYDVLGIPFNKSVSFEVNPVQAIWNMTMPFHIAVGDKPTWQQRELQRLGMPLRQFAPERIDDVKIDHWQRSEWTRIAKNEVDLRGSKFGLRGASGRSYFTFREAIDALLDSSFYHSQKDDSIRDSEFQTKTDKQAGLVRSMERKFYDAAKTILLEVPENQQLYEAIQDRRDAVRLYGE